MPGLTLRSRLRANALRLAHRLRPTARRAMRRLFDALFPRSTHAELQMDYARILGSAGAEDMRSRRLAAKGSRVLIASNIGGYQQGMALDTLLGIALTLRDARVDIMQCDAFLPACHAMDIGTVEPTGLVAGRRPYICATCSSRGGALIGQVGLSRLAMSEFVDERTQSLIHARAMDLAPQEIRSLADDDIAIGEHAFAGTLRFFARGNLSGEPTADGVLRRYAESALLTVAAIERALERQAYDVVVAHHGIYVPQGLVNEVCRAHGVRFVTWNSAYRRQCFIFSHADTYHHTMVTEPLENWENLSWSEELERETLRYLASRQEGGEDWISFLKNPNHDPVAIAAETGIDFSRPMVTLLSNVVWDAQLHYSSNAFPSMIDWVLETIQYFARRPELQLVIRVHPAEITGFLPSRQNLVEEIARTFPNVPANVFVVPPDSPVSTYILCENSNAVLIYNTKTGIEVAAQGIPTVVAGEAWIRNKGFCHNASSPAEYFSILDSLPFPGRMSEAKRMRALKYAYHVFFRRMIPLPVVMDETRTQLRLDVEAISDLAPGRAPGLDIICDGILQGSEFVYPAEHNSAQANSPLQSELRGRAGGSPFNTPHRKKDAGTF